MPAGDGTGPMGMGPMTGRAMGYCAGYPVPGFMNGGPGRGMGWGRGGGRGRGWRHGYYLTGQPLWARQGWWPAPNFAASGFGPAPQQETEALKTQAAHMEKALDEIRKRISELETAQVKEN